jgi:hypothetical protein
MDIWKILLLVLVVMGLLFFIGLVAPIVIRLFMLTTYEPKLPVLPNFHDAYNFDSESNKCGEMCANVTSLSTAVEYCQERIRIDIDGNLKTNEWGHGGIVAGTPYCEDGLYCFHIFDCRYQSYILDAANCLEVMKKYYGDELGIAEETVKNIILNRITPGTCNPDPNKWSVKPPRDYTPTKLPDDKCLKYGYSSPCFVEADFWWRQAGYANI